MQHITYVENDNFTGNPEHLRILKTAVERRDPAMWKDFCKSQGHWFRANLKGAIFNECCLRDMYLDLANLTGCHFQKADLRFASLFAASLQGADFSDAILDFANLESSNLRFANLTRARLLGVPMKNASLVAANLRGALLDKAELIIVDVRLANFSGTNLQRAIVRGITCTADDLNALTLNLRRDQFNAIRVEEFSKEEYNKLMKLAKDLNKRIIKKGDRYVFLSYVHEDQKKVKRLARRLEENGITVWIDRYNLMPGTDWKLAIDNAISEGAFFIACFSQRYFAKNKSYMNEELHIALDQLRLRSDSEIWFIPVKLDDCDIPDFEIRRGKHLRSIQWVDLSKDWDEGVQKVVDVILRAC